MKGIGGNVAYKTLSKAKFWAFKHAPEGLVVAGVAAFGATLYFTVKGTRKYDEVKDEEDTRPQRIKKTVVCYGPAAGFGALALSCFTGGHYILRRRNIALVAAYRAVDDSFKQYRANVVEKYGEDEDRRLKDNLGVTKKTLTTVDEDGKKVKKKVDDEYLDGPLSAYSFIYDDRHCMASVDDPIIVMDRLKTAENYSNTILNARGYITLNEVLKAIGLHETSVGQIVGWQKKGNGDGYVDFGIRLVRSAKDEDGLAYILDFNVDGPIFEDIDKYTRAWEA